MRRWTGEKAVGSFEKVGPSLAFFDGLSLNVRGEIDLEGWEVSAKKLVENVNCCRNFNVVRVT